MKRLAVAMPAPDAPPFAEFVEGLAPRSALRCAVTAATRSPEPQAVAALMAQARLSDALAAACQGTAQRLVHLLRERGSEGIRAGSGGTWVQGLLQEYALSSQEGVALMCLAEALLRIPDAATRDALIRDKIRLGQWQAHAGHSPSMFVNAATWGLMLTGQLVSAHRESGLAAHLVRLIAKGGEPLIRKAVDMAMRMMGEQFVTGETMSQALRHASRREAMGFRYSYDMLGEAAVTAQDAERYRVAYEHAIHAIGKSSPSGAVHERAGISLKLSALHPRYSRSQYGRVMAELYPVLRRLVLLAREQDVGVNIDAEEADRLELSLDLLERLCFEPSLAGWNGIGFVVQAYQKRCPFVIDELIDLARRSQHRLMVRLVKGAYWDSEIKRAQVDALPDYPVYTRKVHTDVSYLACARKLLAAPDAVYPQFATHNAQTVAAIYHLADPDRYWAGQYEFQCLHGMGEPLYEHVVGQGAGQLGRPCRIYAPVGTHETLLAYLVRRLLENGANTSFVNRMLDPSVSVDELIEHPVRTVEQLAVQEGGLGRPHPRIPLPLALYGERRRSAGGLDLANEEVLNALWQGLRLQATRTVEAGALLGRDVLTGPQADAVPVCNPARSGDQVGRVRAATEPEIQAALQEAAGFAGLWAATSAQARATLLEQAADGLQDEQGDLMALLIREAGKTAANAAAEVREAVDFLRFYAAQIRGLDFQPQTHRPLGPVACISPWNFPLAIFIGQVAAALAAGNPVLAKPAEQTPLVAARAVRCLWRAGVPRAALQLLPGPGETVGRRLVDDVRIQGVLFTGSTEVARQIQSRLAQRLDRLGQPVTLVAETGGQNAMIVDSSALLEQVVVDVVQSAFDSAGQRCSALRVLCVQEEVADRLLGMLRGAMAELRVGSPDALAVDVGPVIDDTARQGIQAHIEAMRAQGRVVFQASPEGLEAMQHGHFVLPTLIELQGLGELSREIFGPVLHVVRFARADLDALIAQINATGYGLTLGVHTRLDEVVERVQALGQAGNLYVNRNMVGAVVGVQPFGGEGLSGTGPKAGGPLYLDRLLAVRPIDAFERACAWMGRQADAPSAGGGSHALSALALWGNQMRQPALADACARLGMRSAALRREVELPGPTGERNTYRLQPRQAVLCLADQASDLLQQLAAVLAVGSRAVWAASARSLWESLPVEVRQRIDLVADVLSPELPVQAALHHGDAPSRLHWCQRLAHRPGALVGMQCMSSGAGIEPLALERLCVERSVSANLAAAGGNASLMALA